MHVLSAGRVSDRHVLLLCGLVHSVILFLFDEKLMFLFVLFFHVIDDLATDVFFSFV
jgi:hypothetical protein